MNVERDPAAFVSCNAQLGGTFPFEVTGQPMIGVEELKNPSMSGRTRGGRPMY
jgi:hypothetical protein